jgi:hypothetical protein
MTRKKTLLLTVVTSLLLFSTFVNAGEYEIKLTGIGKLLDGRSYLLIGKDVTCKANDPEHTEIKSWANKISFEGGKVLIWGKVCNDSPESMAISKLGKSLLISANLDIIIFKKQVLKYSKDNPKLCDAGLWCPVEQIKP